MINKIFSVTLTTLLVGMAFLPGITPVTAAPSPGWNALGSGLNGSVYAIAISGSNVYVGGDFTDAGGNTYADHIARWDGSNWYPLGGGLREYEYVRTIAINGSDVYVGGAFSDAGGIANADNIAKWNGSNWSALGGGLNGRVKNLVVNGTDLYVGGFFQDAGGIANADHIAKWNGSNWSALGTGLNAEVYGLAASGSDVYAGGLFWNAGGNLNADQIAGWNGTYWYPLASGLGLNTDAIAIDGSDVYAGGVFTNAGGNPNADHIAFYHYPTQTLRSQASYDGWVLESNETSGKGGTMSSTGMTLYAGDNARRKQYRSILSFNTSTLPDNAVVTRVTLKIRKAGLVGSDPFTNHGNLAVDIRKGAFSSNAALQLTDFQATAGKNAAGVIKNTPVSGWYSVTFGSNIFSYINLAGLTQFRLRFQTDDDNDAIADYLKFYSGNAETASYRPQLIILYSVP